MKHKLFYTQPTTDILEMNVESGLLVGSERSNSVNSGYDESWDLGTI